jgi:hypothetical protein
VTEERSLPRNGKPHRMDKLMEVCLLLLLHEEAGQLDPIPEGQESAYRQIDQEVRVVNWE